MVWREPRSLITLGIDSQYNNWRTNTCREIKKKIKKHRFYEAKSTLVAIVSGYKKKTAE